MPIQNSEVLVTTAQAKLLVAADPQRKALVIVNQGPNQIVIGGASVTVKNGIPLDGTAAPTTTAGASYACDQGSDDSAFVTEEWWAIARTADQVTGAATQVTVGTG